MKVKRQRAKIGDKELQIIDYILNYKDMARTPLAEKMQTEIKWEGKAPEIEVLERKISKYRKEYRNRPTTDPQDKPWSMATLDRPDIPPIPPEALPAVLEVWKLRIDSEEWNFSFSIREAKWAARLSALITDTKELSARAGQYARTEILYQLIGRPFDSRGLDSLITGRFGEDAKRDITGELI